MSTLKTHNLQSPDAGSVNIVMAPNAGMVVAGLSTYSNQINVGSNIKLGNAGVITATSFSGSGANLTSLPAQASISNNANNRVITGGSGVNLNGESNLTFDGSTLGLTGVFNSGGNVNCTSGRFQRGSATVQDGDAIAGGLNINGTDMDASVIMSVFGNDNDFTRISGSKSRNASVGSHTIVQDNDVLLSLKGFGSDGTNFEEAAQIEMQVDGTPNNNVMPGRIVFKTATTDGVAERFRIKSNGQIVLGSDGTNSELTFTQDGTSGTQLNATTTGSGGYNTLSINSATFIHKYGGNERLRIDSTGRTLLGTGAIGGTKITGPGGLDVSQYGLSICMGGSSGSSGQARANATTKEARLVIPHYTNAEEPLTAIAAFSTSSYNYINYGGGTSLGNVATRHQFYTAANTTTTGGSEKLKIEHSGVRSFATFVDTSYHANPDPFADGSGVAYYRMNYNFHDSGLFAKHGTSSDGTAVTGQPHFSLVNSSGEPCWDNPNEGAINLPNLKDSYPFSMAAWINVSSWPTSADNDVIMNLSIGNARVTLCICCWSAAPSDGADFYIMYGGQGHHYFRPSSKPTNEWIHVVYSVVGADNTSHRVYQNGSDLTTRANRGGGHGGSPGWRLGGNANGSERFAIGKIGSIRFFNKALSASEANTLYQNDTFYT